MQDKILRIFKRNKVIQDYYRSGGVNKQAIKDSMIGPNSVKVMTYDLEASTETLTKERTETIKKLRLNDYKVSVESQEQKNTLIRSGIKESKIVVEEVHLKSQDQEHYEEIRRLLVNELNIGCFSCGITNSQIQKLSREVEVHNRKLSPVLKTFEDHMLYYEKNPRARQPLSTLTGGKKRLQLHRFFCELKDVDKMDLRKWNSRIVPRIHFMSPILLEYYSKSVLEKELIYESLDSRGMLSTASTKDRIFPRIDLHTSRQELRNWVDTNLYNMMVLCSECHRGYGRSVHQVPCYEWISRAGHYDSLLRVREEQLKKDLKR